MTPTIGNTLPHEIEIVQEKFQRFLVTIPQEGLPCPSKNITWTNEKIPYKISVFSLVFHSVLRRNFGPWTQRVLPGTGPPLSKIGRKIRPFSFL